MSTTAIEQNPSPIKDYLALYRDCDNQHLTRLERSIKQAVQNQELPEKIDFPITVQFELMSECNLKCLHCYNRSGDDDLNTDVKLDQWIQISNHLVEQGGIFQCILSGGEPLLMGKHRLPKIMDVLHADGTSFVLITNGWLLDQEWVDILARYRFYWVQVSIDGVSASYHDYFRGVDGSWERAVNGAFLISKAGLPLVIAHTVTPKNLQDVAAMADLAYQLGATSLILGEVLPSGRANEHTDIVLTPEERNQLYHQLELLAKSYKGRMEIQRSSGVHYQLNRYRIVPNMGCIIRPNGDVRMDCMAPFVIGNVLEKTFSAIWREKGSDCWQNPVVIDYISSVDPVTNMSNIHRNHVESDIQI